MLFILFITLGTYAIATLFLVVIWQRYPNFKNTEINNKKNVFVSVIIPIRNEENNIENIIQDINKQSFNKNKFEVIVVNDYSTDNSLEILKRLQNDVIFELKIINLPYLENNLSPKKRAITTAINEAKGELILATDGDCRLAENWIATIVEYYKITDAYFISSPVTFLDNRNATIFQKIANAIQIIEFGSLVGSAACSIKIGNPNMCSGANIAYKKDAFFAVNGYEGNEQIASGDDEFLMHKIAKAYPNKVQFLKSRDAIVQTEAHNSFTSFYQQRKRWASKWRFYTNKKITALAVYVAFINGLTAWAIATGKWDLVCIKLVFEFIFLMQIVRFMNKKWTIPFILLTQLIYPFYVLFFAVISQFKGNYIWKERLLK